MQCESLVEDLICHWVQSCNGCELYNELSLSDMPRAQQELFLSFESTNSAELLYFVQNCAYGPTRVHMVLKYLFLNCLPTFIRQCCWIQIKPIKSEWWSVIFHTCMVWTWWQSFKSQINMLSFLLCLLYILVGLLGNVVLNTTQILDVLLSYLFYSLGSLKHVIQYLLFYFIYEPQ